MAQDDLSGLKIDKTLKKQPLTGSRKWTAAAVVAVLLVGASVLYALGVLTPSVTVETAAVSQVYPSQGLTVLNASGYVVAQRRAAVASKATAAWLRSWSRKEAVCGKARSSPGSRMKTSSRQRIRPRPAGMLPGRTWIRSGRNRKSQAGLR